MLARELMFIHKIITQHDDLIRVLCCTENNIDVKRMHNNTSRQTNYD